MTIACERADVQAWALSAALHILAVTAALLLASHIKPMQSQETFEWNVSLVETPQEPPVEPIVQAARPPAPAQPLSPQVQPMQAVAAASPQLLEAPKAIERPSVETIEQSAMILHRQETATQQVLQPIQEVTPVQEAEQLSDTAVQSVVPVETPIRIETAAQPLHSATAVSAPREEQKESLDLRPAPVVASHPAQSVEQTVEPPVKSLPLQTAAVPRELAAPQVFAEPLKPAAMAVQQAAASRADYGWLVESIGKRLAELKRYPPAARLNGWEGKVVLRAVIKADGNLADVKVQKSSGHEALDEAAIESMRQACPLHMRHELGRPEIVVNIPVLYALAR